MNFKKFFLYFFIIVFLVFLDQYSKNYFIELLTHKPGMIYKVNDYFDFVYAWNYGISFGLFSDYKSSSNYIFIFLNISIILYLLTIIKDMSCESQKIGIVVIIGGALGNIYDRFDKGAVFDFISIHYKEYYFPAFNLADFFVNLGVFIIIISMINQKLRLQ